MLRPSILALLAFLPFPVWTLRWAPEFVGYNLNENEEATEPTDYWGEWKNHTYHPSPSNWRFPFYVLTIDRYVDGDPTNNEANGTNFEHNWMTNQFRFGGDVKGLQFDLDYVQGMGIRVSRISRLRLYLIDLERASTLRGVPSSICLGVETDSGHWILRSLIATTETLRIGGPLLQKYIVEICM